MWAIDASHVPIPDHFGRRMFCEIGTELGGMERAKHHMGHPLGKRIYLSHQH